MPYLNIINNKIGKIYLFILFIQNNDLSRIDCSFCTNCFTFKKTSFKKIENGDTFH